MDKELYSIKPGYLLREIAGEHLAVPVNTVGSQQIVILNSVSAFLWNELQTNKTLDELAEAVISSFDVSKEEVLPDIIEFINDLKEKNLLN